MLCNTEFCSLCEKARLLRVCFRVWFCKARKLPFQTGDFPAICTVQSGKRLPVCIGRRLSANLILNSARPGVPQNALAGEEPRRLRNFPERTYSAFSPRRKTKNKCPGIHRSIYPSSKTNLCLFPHLCKALAAIYRTVFTRPERHFSFFSAACAYGCEHLAFRLRSVLASIAAGLASLRLVYKALGCVKFLLTGGENEFSAAFLACECFVFVHLIYLALD